jgi:hypothetical protein
VPTDRGLSANWTLVSSELGIEEPPKTIQVPGQTTIEMKFSEVSLPGGMTKVHHPSLKTEPTAGTLVSRPVDVHVGCEDRCFYCEGPETD